MNPEPHNPGEKWKKENKPTESDHSKLSVSSCVHTGTSIREISPTSKPKRTFPKCKTTLVKALQQLPTILGIKFTSLTWPLRTYNAKVTANDSSHAGDIVSQCFSHSAASFQFLLRALFLWTLGPLHIFHNLHLFSILPVGSSLGATFFSVNAPWAPDLFVISRHCVIYFTKLASTLWMLFDHPLSPLWSSKFPTGKEWFAFVHYLPLSTEYGTWHRQGTP